MKTQVSIQVSKIVVGKRHRKALGDIAALAADIDDLGLLQPIVITPKHELIAGYRRIEAWKRSRFRGRPIPCHVVDLEAIVRGEASENTQRKDFTPSEMVAIKRELEPLAKAEAKERQRAHGGTAPGRGAQSPTAAKGRAMDHISRYLGRDRRTMEKAEAVVKAAEADPKRFGAILEEMDRSGRVHTAFKWLSGSSPAAARLRPSKASIFDTVAIGRVPLGDFNLPELRRIARLVKIVIAKAGVPGQRRAAAAGVRLRAADQGGARCRLVEILHTHVFPAVSGSACVQACGQVG